MFPSAPYADSGLRQLHCWQVQTDSNSKKKGKRVVGRDGHHNCICMYGHSPSPYKPISSRPGSLVGMVMALHTVIIQFIMGMGTYKLSHHKQNVTVQLGES